LIRWKDRGDEFGTAFAEEGNAFSEAFEPFGLFAGDEGNSAQGQ
jgi:hypothetical protein